MDWNVGRSRFWGTPLPIWTTEDGTETRCIDSYAALRRAVQRSVKAGFMRKALPTDFDPHRPYIDEVVLCSKKGKPMRRVPEVADVWFDSGAMPYAQQHYLLGRSANKKPEHFPADFIAEGVDQTRGWFFSLHALGVLLFDEPAFKRVFVNGLLLDAAGNKMSKRLGNSVDVFKLLDTHGADALRCYLSAAGQAGDDIKFTEKEIVAIQRNFLGTLLNTYRFFALYAKIDRFQYKLPPVWFDYREDLDRWVLSELNTLTKEVRKAYENYRPDEAMRLIQQFVVDDVSNWYVRQNRERFWQSGQADHTPRKRTAYETLYECLLTTVQLAAPIAPFLTEGIYQGLMAFTYPSLREQFPISVHLCHFPEPKMECVDYDLIGEVFSARRICHLGHALRKERGIKVRTQISRVRVVIASNFDVSTSISTLQLGQELRKKPRFISDVYRYIPPFSRTGEMVRRELNALLFSPEKFDINSEKYRDFKLEVNPRTDFIRMTFGEKRTQDILDALRMLNDSEEGQKTIRKAVSGNYSPVISVKGEKIKIHGLLVVILLRPPRHDERWVWRHDGGNTCVGIPYDGMGARMSIERESLRHLQVFRKEKGFAVEDRIELYLYFDGFPHFPDDNDTPPSLKDKELINCKRIKENIQADVFEILEDKKAFDKLTGYEEDKRELTISGAEGSFVIYLKGRRSPKQAKVLKREPTDHIPGFPL